MLTTGIIIVAIIGAVWMFALMGCAKMPKPKMEKPTAHYRLNQCPACGCNRIKMTEVGKGGFFIARHYCNVPQHSKCQTYLSVESEFEAASMWNYTTEKWIKDRDLTQPK